MSTSSILSSIRDCTINATKTPSKLAKLLGYTEPSRFHKPTMRHFKPTATSLALLRTNTGTPAFKTFTSIPASRFEDVYYDTLMANGSLLLRNSEILLRRRTGLWQLVLPPSSSKDTAYEGDGETLLYEGRETVEDCLAEMMGWKELRLGHAGPFIEDEVSHGLREVGRWFTLRERWEADGVGVAVDETDFGYLRGEVTELADEGKKPVREQDRGVDKVMDEYAWAFPGKVDGYSSLAIGKLEAFLEAKGKGPVEVSS